MDPMMMQLMAKVIVITVLLFAGLVGQDILHDYRRDQSNPF